MNVNKVLTKDYEDIANWTLGENEPKTNPIKANKMPKQTQYKAKQSQTKPIKANFRSKKMLLPGQSARRPSCRNGCQDKICNSLIDLALH